MDGDCAKTKEGTKGFFGTESRRRFGPLSGTLFRTKGFVLLQWGGPGCG